MIWGILILVLLASPVEAKNLYVNNSGSPACNNGTTYANNDAANPWCLIGRAAWGSTDPASPSTTQAAQAGDIVLVTAGTYTTIGTRTAAEGCSGNGRWAVALSPANSGTSGNLITFRAVGTVTVLLDADYVGPTLGVSGRDYVQWDGFTLNDATAGDNSCYDGALLTLHDTTGSVALRNTITGTTKATGSDDTNNYSAIRLEGASNLTVKNNTLSHFYTSGTFSCGSNCSGITLYDVASSVIEHNDISDVSTGIYVKGDHADDGLPQELVTIRRNRIHDVNTAIGLGAADRAQVSQNIITESVTGIRVYGFAAPQSSNITIQNNVIASANLSEDLGLRVSNTGNVVNLRVFNNIFYGSWYEVINFGLEAPGDVEFEHNVYNGYDAWGSYSGAQRTFATWTGTGQDSAAPASVTSDPLFVDTTNYKLTGSSPGKNLGVDILDLDGDTSTTDNVDAGAYITGNETIGIESASGPVNVAGNASFIGNVRIR